MEIDIRTLKSVIDRLFTHIVDFHGMDRIEIQRENYWNIPYPDVYEGKRDPGALDVGSFCDDWEFLSGLTETDEPVAYQLTQLAPLIRYIGEVAGRELASKGG